MLWTELPAVARVAAVTAARVAAVARARVGPVAQRKELHVEAVDAEILGPLAVVIVGEGPERRHIDARRGVGRAPRGGRDGRREIRIGGQDHARGGAAG